MPRLAVDLYTVGVDARGPQQPQRVRDGLTRVVVGDDHDTAQQRERRRVVARGAGHGGAFLAAAHGLDLAGLGVALAR